MPYTKMLYALLFVACALLACGRDNVDSIDPLVPAPNVEQISDSASKSDPLPIVEETSTPLPGVPYDKDDNQVTRSEDAEETNKENVETTGAPHAHTGKATLKERIAGADVIGLMRMVTVTTGVEEIEPEAHRGVTTPKQEFVGVLKFTFDVREYYKLSAGIAQSSRITALVGSLRRFSTRTEAKAEADEMLAYRDTQWDNRDAVVFLVSASDEFPTTKSDDLFFMSLLDFQHGIGDAYSIASDRSKLWLPEANQSSDAQASAERRFLTDVPQTNQAGGQTSSSTSQSATDSTSITLSDLKTKIEHVKQEMSAGTGYAYQICVAKTYQRERYKAFQESQGRSYEADLTFEREIGSGLSTGVVILDDTLQYSFSADWAAKMWFEGEHTDILAIGDSTGTSTRTLTMQNSFNAYGAKFLITETRNIRPLETTRPVPKGVYNFVWNYIRVEFVPCDQDYVLEYPITLTVTAPTGTLHEAFFDPVTVGTAIAADATNGVLKPTAFTDGNSASATLQRIAWESPSTGSGQAGTVKLKLSPHTGLANHVLDFIGLDGKVILSLDADDATVDAANNTLSWPVTHQPWKDGDKLMLRIHDGPVTPVPTPAAPTGLTATAGAGSVTLTWDNPLDSTITGYEYNMRWAGVAWQPWKAIPNSGSSTTSHTVTGLTGDTEYRFHVRAVNASGPGTAAPNADPWYVAATPSVPPPAVPTGLTATAGRESVKLSWNNPSDSTITRYEYNMRWTGVGWQPWKAIPNSGSSTTSHTVTGLTGGTEYRFHVRAVNASGAGPQAPNAPPWYVSATPGKR